MGEAPGRAVGQLDRGEVAEVVQSALDGPAERVAGARFLAVGAVFDAGPGAHRVDRRGQPTAGGVLVPPGPAVRVGPGDQLAGGLVVGVGGAVPGRGDGGGDPAQVVAFQPGRVVVGVGD